ncbi:MAG: DUF4126 domain-containing protein [Chitinophagales bacterium]
MNAFSPDIFLGLAAGLGLSACCGFRVFTPLLVAAIAGKMGWLPQAANLNWLSSWPALICFATASVAEIAAYYIPVVDHFLDLIATPSAVVAGTVVSASTLVGIDPMWQWILGLMVGGASAGVIQAGTALLRIGSAKTTAATANPIVATAENVASIGGSLLALIAPVLMAVIISVLLILIILALNKFFLSKKRKDKPHRA